MGIIMHSPRDQCPGAILDINNAIIGIVPRFRLPVTWIDYQRPRITPRMPVAPGCHLQVHKAGKILAETLIFLNINTHIFVHFLTASKRWIRQATWPWKLVRILREFVKAASDNDTINTTKQATHNVFPWTVVIFRNLQRILPIILIFINSVIYL